MNREHAQTILNNLETVKHFANGGKVYFPLVRHDGILYKWEECDRMLLNCLKNYQVAPTIISEPVICKCPACGPMIKEE